MKTYILLDRSSSMDSQWAEAIGSVNGYVDKLKEQYSNSEVSLDVFDNVSYDRLRNCKLDEWIDVSPSEAFPRGGTPLLDAAGRLFEEVKSSNQDRAVVVIMTDGEENNSTTYKSADIKKLMKTLEVKGYQVLFLGANFDKIADEAKKFGGDINKTISLNKSDFGKSFRSLASATMSYYATGNELAVGTSGDWVTKSNGITLKGSSVEVPEVPIDTSSVVKEEILTVKKPSTSTKKRTTRAKKKPTE